MSFCWNYFFTQKWKKKLNFPIQTWENWVGCRFFSFSRPGTAMMYHLEYPWCWFCVFISLIAYKNNINKVWGTLVEIIFLLKNGEKRLFCPHTHAHTRQTSTEPPVIVQTYFFKKIPKKWNFQIVSNDHSSLYGLYISLLGYRNNSRMIPCHSVDIIFSLKNEKKKNLISL